MAKVKLTAGRVASFQCVEGKAQSFLWCSEVPGLGVRATAGSQDKRYIFQSKVKGQSMRVTIGKISVWSIPEAQMEARRLQILIDQGNDPRQVKVDEEAAKVAANLAHEARLAARAMQEACEAITLGTAWPEYVAERKPLWSDLHLRDHMRVMQLGGEKRSRSQKLTEPGTLAALAHIRLVDLTDMGPHVWNKIKEK
jgi:hypothetical protein